jgi:GNAT superfamily N-acetyltransferase
VAAVYVAPRWRRRYWGSALAERLGEELAARGAGSIQAAAGRDDRVAAAFWSSLGWRPALTVYARPLAPAGQPVRLGLLNQVRTIARLLWQQRPRRRSEDV